jgi:hypothetical protein
LTIAGATRSTATGDGDVHVREHGRGRRRISAKHAYSPGAPSQRLSMWSGISGTFRPSASQTLGGLGDTKRLRF